MLSAVVFGLGLIGVAIASAAVVPLHGVASLTLRPGLRRAWQALIATILVCMALQLASLFAKRGEVVGIGDLAAAGIHLLGPCFVLAIALLSRSTARDAIRMAALEEAALHDALTGLPNRRCFDERLGQALRVAQSDRSPLSLLVLDVDHFKRVNDTYGHGAGDAALREVAGRLLANIRLCDTAARIGGEEFAVILPGLDATAAARRAEQIRAAISEVGITLNERQTSRLTISLGLAALTGEQDAEELLASADAALYAAKRAGRNRLKLAAA